MPMALIAVLAAAVQAAGVPLPPPKPAIPAAPAVAVETPHGPATGCDQRLAAIAAFVPRPSVAGPGQCGGADLVSLRAVRLADGHEIAIEPPAVLRCEMAESLAAWVRDEVAPRFAARGSALTAVRQADSYTCRNRDNAKTGRISEHAHGNALDISSFVTADRRSIAPTDVNEPKALREALRETACRRFTTVLGPGEPAHDTHIHLDVLERTHGYRICSWDVREPPAPVVAKAAATAASEAKPRLDNSMETTGAAVSVVLPPENPRRRHR
jgi:hypothetical protein